MDLIDKLKIAFQNESNIEHLLPFKYKTIETLLDLINKQQNYINKLKDFKILKVIYEQELEIVKQLIKDYLLRRIYKIQKYNVKKEYLNENELIFYEKLENLYNKMDIKKLDLNHETVVGFIALKNLDNVVLDGNVVMITKGDKFITDLNEIMPYLIKEEIMLL